MVSSCSNLLSPIILHVLFNTVAADFKTILNQTVFNNLAQEATTPYTYAGFVNAVDNWNNNNAGHKIFSGGTEMELRHELAAFFGNTLHESDAFRASREYFMCATTNYVDPNLYCKLSTAALESHQYCSTNHQDPSLIGYEYEDGCNCATESGDSEGYVPANQLYFGRGEYFIRCHSYYE